ncbi:MAG: hypothetical protein KYX62_08530 [Pseudomonadota bacterium]|nr:hypothetical protein [Pseudomonadota bacterium]
MALKCCLTLGALIAAAPVCALEELNEQDLADVSGQAQGLRYTSEFDARVDSITYIDDDGLAGGPVGTVSLCRSVCIRPPTARFRLI